MDRISDQESVLKGWGVADRIGSAVRIDKRILRIPGEVGENAFVDYADAYRFEMTCHNISEPTLAIGHDESFCEVADAWVFCSDKRASRCEPFGALAQDKKGFGPVEKANLVMVVEMKSAIDSLDRLFGIARLEIESAECPPIGGALRDKGREPFEKEDCTFVKALTDIAIAHRPQVLELIIGPVEYVEVIHPFNVAPCIERISTIAWLCSLVLAIMAAI